jgi:hypothetical protein
MCMDSMAVESPTHRYSSFAYPGVPYASILIVEVHFWIDEEPTVPGSPFSTWSSHCRLEQHAIFSWTYPYSSYIAGENPLHYMLDHQRNRHCIAWHAPPISV